MKHVVIDLEMNPIQKKDPARKICRLEIIEIGAVMLNDELQEVGTFQTYVKPEYNTGIAKNITRLTGITDESVRYAPVFNEALRQFTDWCREASEEVMIYSWSNSDYIQIKKEMELKQYEVTAEEESLLHREWSDFQQEFDTHLGFQKQLSLSMALEMAGVDFSGREHDALDDARNTAELLQIFRDEELFNQTLAKIKEALEPKTIGSTLGDLFDFSSIAVES